MDTPVSVMETAGEGGAWGIAVLASYMINKGKKSLAEFLEDDVFASQKMITSTADDKLKESFNNFMVRYTKGLKVERAAVEL
jgi:lipopolysaccharide biosynthesis protein